MAQQITMRLADLEEGDRIIKIGTTDHSSAPLVVEQPLGVVEALPGVMAVRINPTKNGIDQYLWPSGLDDQVIIFEREEV